MRLYHLTCVDGQWVDGVWTICRHKYIAPAHNPGGCPRCGGTSYGLGERAAEQLSLEVDGA
jgi:hypothetical protein